MPTNRDRLHHLIEKLCIIEGDFVLSTGAKSRYYFDCKTVALDGEGLALIAGEFLKEIDKLPVKPTAIGGLPWWARQGGEKNAGVLPAGAGRRRGRGPAAKSKTSFRAGRRSSRSTT